MSANKPFLLIYENKKKQLISYSIVSKPRKIIVEEITKIKIKVLNNSNEELDLVLFEDINTDNNSISISSLSHHELGIVKGLDFVEFTISFIAKISGIQKITGIGVRDKKSKTEWKMKDLDEILVEN